MEWNSGKNERDKRCAVYFVYYCIQYEDDAPLQNLVKSEVPIKRREQTLRGGGISRKSDNSAHW